MFRRSAAYEFAELIVYHQQLMDCQASLEARLLALLAAAPEEPLPVSRQSVEATQLFHNFRARGLRGRAEETRPANQPLRQNPNQRGSDEKGLDPQIEKSAHGGRRVIGVEG